jgi:2-methylisocitrate lyase-like PEP mutase family enzyme
VNNTNFKTFYDLHHQTEPLLLPNAWDAASAVIFQLEGAKAVATSSAALAWSLGYADGGSLPPRELVAAVRRMLRVLQVPLTVDLEEGYSDSAGKVAELILELAQCGVAGINIEDGTRPPALLVEKIVAARKLLGDTGFFINARTDVFLQSLARGEAAVAMAIERLHQYRAAGADGVFVPGMNQIDDVKKVAGECELPLNLVTMPDMPPLRTLFDAGVRRISVGTRIFASSYGHARRLAKAFTGEHDISELFSHPVTYAEMNAVFPST